MHLLWKSNWGFHDIVLSAGLVSTAVLNLILPDEASGAEGGHGVEESEDVEADGDD